VGRYGLLYIFIREAEGITRNRQFANIDNIGHRTKTNKTNYKTENNTDPTKNYGGTQVLTKGKQFLFLFYKTLAVLLIVKSDKSIVLYTGKNKSTQREKIQSYDVERILMMVISVTNCVHLISNKGN